MRKANRPRNDLEARRLFHHTNLLALAAAVRLGPVVPPARREGQGGMKTINQPGVREKDGGLVLQYTRRGEQVELIATSFQVALNRVKDGETLEPQEIHRLLGYTEQLGIISDELKGA